MLNRVEIIGRVGRDPEIRHSQDGNPIANFTVATSERWRDRQTGERKEKTEWVRVVCFNEGLCKVIEAYVSKGTKLYLSGKLQTRKYTDSNNVERYQTEVVMQRFQGEIVLLDSRRDDEDEPRGRQANDEPAGADDQDSIPF